MKQLIGRIVIVLAALLAMSVPMFGDTCEGQLEGYNYKLSPCLINVTMTDGMGNVPVLFDIVQVDEPAKSYRFATLGTFEGLPAYALLGGLSGATEGTQNITLQANDNVLDATSGPRIYTGKITVELASLFGSPEKVRIESWIKITVLPAPGPTPTPAPTANPDDCSGYLGANRYFYRLNPCQLDLTLVDGTGNQQFSFKVTQDFSPERIYQFELKPGEAGLPTDTLLGPMEGINYGTETFNLTLNDAVLESDGASPRLYEGRLPVRLFIPPGFMDSGVEKTLYLTIRITVLPPLSATPTPSPTPLPVGAECFKQSFFASDRDGTIVPGQTVKYWFVINNQCETINPGMTELYIKLDPRLRILEMSDNLRLLRAEVWGTTVNSHGSVGDPASKSVWVTAALPSSLPAGERVWAEASFRTELGDEVFRKLNLYIPYPEPGSVVGSFPVKLGDTTFHLNLSVLNLTTIEWQEVKGEIEIVQDEGNPVTYDCQLVELQPGYSILYDRAVGIAGTQVVGNVKKVQVKFSGDYANPGEYSGFVTIRISANNEYALLRQYFHLTILPLGSVIPTPTAAPLAADLNHDGQVDAKDLFIMNGQWHGGN